MKATFFGQSNQGSTRYACVGALALVFAACASHSAEEPDAYLLMDRNVLVEAKTRWHNGDQRLEPAKNSLLKRASFALTRGPFTVTTKNVLPPSGDVHDYLTYALEWWPQQKRGAPWVRREGKHNPASKVDADSLVRLSKDCEVLALAYYLTDDERYARHLNLLLRTWFLDDATRMNPNAKFSSIIPGRQPTGFAVAGLTNIFVKLINAAQLVELTDEWTAADSRALKAWMLEFHDWMEASSEGRQKAVKKNNHGTHYDLFAAMLALYADERVAARTHILRFRDRLENQLAADGSQPNEMDRHNNLGYHRYNLQAALKLARLADQFPDIDLWQHTSHTGVGLKVALDFLAPYAAGDENWDRFPQNPVEQRPGEWLDLYASGAQAYGDEWSNIIEVHRAQAKLEWLHAYTLIIAF